MSHAPSQPTRSLGLSGATNFRDLGGYRTQDGRSVRWRKVFRSDHLADLSAEDQRILADIGLTRSFDFRGIEERAGAAYALPGVRQYPLPIEPTVVQNLRAMLESGRAMRPADAVALMQQTYRAFVHDNTHRFEELFAHLLESDAPSVFHCTAGKDRTGFAAALLLRALGVDQHTVMQDYLLTNDLYKRPRIAHSDLPLDVLQVVWEVQAAFLQASLDLVERDYGGLDRYLARALKLDTAALDRLRSLYLAPAN